MEPLIITSESIATASGKTHAPDRSFELLAEAFGHIQDHIIEGGYDKEDVSLFISSSKGALTSFCSKGEWNSEITPPDRAGVYIAQKFGLKGTLSCVTAACATGIFAIDSARRHIALGLAEKAIVAVTESALTPAVLAGFRNMGVLASSKTMLCAKNRDGFTPGEGAAVITIEKGSGKNQVAILATACMTSPYHHISLNTDGVDIARCIIRCLKSASLSPKDIGAVCLHGTATVNNDLAEANAVRAVFGSYDVPCFGIKPQFGHLLGSSALVEVVICSDAVRRRIIPSSLLYGSPDPLCSLNLSAETGELKSPYILSLNFGFGGHIAAVIIGKI